MSRVEEAITATLHESDAIAIRVEFELRATIEQQRAMMQVALGYIQSGRPDRAALVLAEKQD